MRSRGRRSISRDGRGLSVLSNNSSRLTRTSRRTFLTSSHLQVSALILDITHFRSAPFPGTLLTCHYLSRTKLHKSQPQISPYTSPYISTILDLSRMFIIISIVFIDPLCLHLGYSTQASSDSVTRYAQCHLVPCMSAFAFIFKPSRACSARFCCGALP